MAANSYNRYSDGLAQKKRRRFFVKLSIILASIIASAGLTVYALFFSSLLSITKISVEGTRTIDASEIIALVTSDINQISHVFPIKLRKDILFFSESLIKKEILAKYSVIKNIEIKKNIPNDVVIVITERTPAGTWCQNNGCRYFDSDGMMWGSALRSSGSLLLAVDDMRASSSSDTTEISFMETIKKLAAGFEKLSIKITKIEIPADSIGDIRVHTVDGYYVVFNIDSDINKQLDTLRIFLNNKNGDTQMQYIDVSIEGRAYYK